MASIVSAGTTSGTSLNLSADTSGVLQLATNGTTTAVTIDTSQNVGIGTGSPASRLSVTGSANIATFDGGANTSITLTGSSRSDIFLIDSGAATDQKRLTIRGDGGNLIFGVENDAITNFTERLRLNTTGNLVLQGGTTTANGVGITFPATQSASSDANTLDDYEEGTWTPAIQGSTTAGTASYSNNAGRYTKIGRQVFVEAYIDWFSGTGTGNLRIGNLPFTATNDDFYRPGISIGQLNNVTLTASNIATAWIDKNTSFIAMQQYPVGGGAATDVAYDIAGRISFGAVYTI